MNGTVQYELEYDVAGDKLTVRSIYGQALEDYPQVMAAVIDKFIELKRVPRLVVTAEAREYEYEYEETKLLYEIADALMTIRSRELVSLSNILASPACDAILPGKFGLVQKILSDMRYDPVHGYRELLHEIRFLKIKLKKLGTGEPLAELALLPPELCRECLEHYLNNTLLPIRAVLDGCKLIQAARAARPRGRDFYRRIFHPSTRPTFMYTRFTITPPPGAELLERYMLGESQVEIFRLPGSVRKLYHITPPEFRLHDEEYAVLDQARRMLGRHEPSEAEIAEPQRFRENIFNISLDMVREISRTVGRMPEPQMRKLADILTRYTAGLGILEVLLADEQIQDVLINSPIGTVPLYIVHGDHLECETNITPSAEDGESWATRFRLQSGRPLDEANPVLDTELIVPGGRARVAAITRPLSPDGIAFAFRRHRDKPWTFPLFIRAGMLDSFAAGLLWFIIDGARTMLIAGTRGSGKSSFLGACMVQIMPKIRIITTEDTLELPVVALRELGFNIERLKSRSVITHVETELPAEEALRTALRLGDSALILGEVRSAEALALYEAMRIGALANVVAGTIHGESAYGVFDRVVHDLGVPPTSFKATDLILICNTLRSPDGMHMFRRITELTEVRKHWQTDPGIEGGFVPLLEYSSKEDKLKPSRTLLMGESSVLGDIANRVRDWKSNWEAVWDNINLRAKILQTLVDAGAAKPSVLEAANVIRSNAQFHSISGAVRSEIGTLDSRMIYEQWLAWLKAQT